MKACTCEDEIAAILGHEIAHKIAGRGLEDWNGSDFKKFILLPLGVVAYSGCFEPLIACIAALPSVISIFIALAGPRNREKEADYIGMLLMSAAGFNPQGAVTIWENMKSVQESLMQKNPKAKNSAEWMSTHPHVSLYRHEDLSISDFKVYHSASAERKLDTRGAGHHWPGTTARAFF